MEEQTQPQQAPTQTASVSPIPMKQSNKSLIIMFVLVFLLMAGGLVYLGYQNYQLQSKVNQLLQEEADQTAPKNQPSSSSTPILDPATNWKTYTNAKHGFLIKHPVDLNESTENLDFGSFGNKIFFSVTNTNPINCRGDCPIIDKTEKTYVANLEATKIEGWQGEVGGCGPQRYLSYFFVRDKNYITFTLYAATCEELRVAPKEIVALREEDINLFNLIISTFKFLD